MPRKLTTGQRIRRAREAADLLQEAAAKRAGIEQTYWSRIERGVHEPGIPLLRKVARALDTTVAELVG